LGWCRNCEGYGSKGNELVNITHRFKKLENQGVFWITDCTWRVVPKQGHSTKILRWGGTNRKLWGEEPTQKRSFHVTPVGGCIAGREGSNNNRRSTFKSLVVPVVNHDKKKKAISSWGWLFYWSGFLGSLNVGEERSNRGRVWMPLEEHMKGGNNDQKQRPLGNGNSREKRLLMETQRGKDLWKL